MDALILDTENKTAVVKSIPKPTPGPTEVLIHVHSLALNPVDALYTAHPLGANGRVVGSDFAGTIAALGSSVPVSSKLTVGMRVAGFLQGACSVNERPGAFAEYAVCEWDLVWRVPDGVGLQDAAGVSLCALTAAQGVWARMGLRAPFDWEGSAASKSGTGGAEINVFVYGASTSVGLYAAQLVRLSASLEGKCVKLFGTASKSRFDLLKSAPYAYDVLVDYHDNDWGEQIRQAVGAGGIHYAYDSISEGTTVSKISNLLNEHGRMAIVRSRAAGAWSPEGLAPGIDPIYGAVWEGLGAEIKYQGFTVAKSDEARAFAVAFYAWLSKGGSAGGLLVTNPVRVMPGGLERIVQDGFELLGSGKVGERKQTRSEEWMRPVGAEKLVYNLL